MDSPFMQRTVYKTLDGFQRGNYFVSYVLKVTREVTTYDTVVYVICNTGYNFTSQFYSPPRPVAFRGSSFLWI